MKNDSKWNFNITKKEKLKPTETVLQDIQEEQEMAKKEENVETKEKVYTRFMLGTFLDPMNGEWKLAYVAFNPVTGDIGELKTERVAGDAEVMRERLVIKQSQLGLFDGAPITEEKKLEIY